MSPPSTRTVPIRASALVGLLAAFIWDNPSGFLRQSCGALEATGRPSGPDRFADHALVIVIDTLRADALDRAHTPHIDALRFRGESVRRAWSSGTWTVPSVISMFTGRHVRQHGWDLPSAKIGRYPKLPATPTLAEVLDKAGFETTGLFANPYLAEALGFSRGFDRWSRIDDDSAVEHLAESVTRWSEDRQFTYVHLLGPHSPLRPSAAARRRQGVEDTWIDPNDGFRISVAKRARRSDVYRAYERAYLAVVEDTDAIVGQLLATVEPWLDKTLVVLTSDHGELLGEHDLVGHGSHIFEPLTHVPFIVLNGGAVATTLATASLADVVTSALGVPHPWLVSATASLPLMSQREGQIAFSPDGEMKVILDDHGARAYDLVTDPGETTPQRNAGALIKATQAWLERTHKEKPAELTAPLQDDTRRELEALGYVDSP